MRGCGRSSVRSPGTLWRNEPRQAQTVPGGSAPRTKQTWTEVAQTTPGALPKPSCGLNYRWPPADGISVPGLMTATGMGRRWVYYRLRELADVGRAIQTERGNHIPEQSPSNPEHAGALGGQPRQMIRLLLSPTRVSAVTARNPTTGGRRHPQ